MADQGFLIQDLLEPKKATLTIPPFLSRSRSLQFTSKEVQKHNRLPAFIFMLNGQFNESKNTKFLTKFCHFRWLVQ